MTTDDAQFLFALGRFSPAHQMAVLNVANECQLPPTKAMAKHLSHTEIFPRLVLAHRTAAAPGEDTLRRAVVQPDIDAHADGGEVSIARSLCDELASPSSDPSTMAPD